MVPKNGNPKTVQLKNKYAKIKAHNLFKKRCYQNGNMFFQKNGSQNGSPQTFKKNNMETQNNSLKGVPKWKPFLSEKMFPKWKPKIFPKKDTVPKMGGHFFKERFQNQC